MSFDLGVAVAAAARGVGTMSVVADGRGVALADPLGLGAGVVEVCGLELAACFALDFPSMARFSFRRSAALRSVSPR